MSLTSLDRKLLARLQKHGVISEEQAGDLAARAEKSPVSFAKFLIEAGVADDKTIARQAAKLYGMEFVDLERHDPPANVSFALAPEHARRCRAVPIADTPDFLLVAVADGSNLLLIDELHLLTGRTIRTVLVTDAALSGALQRYYPESGAPASPQVAPPLPVVPFDSAPMQRTSASDIRVPSHVSSGAVRVSGAVTPPMRLRPSTSQTNVPRISTTQMGKMQTVAIDRNSTASDALASHPTRIISLPDMASEADEQDEARQMAVRSDEYIRRTGSSAEDLLLKSGFVRKISTAAAPSETPESLDDEGLDKLLHEMLDTALMNRAEEVQFAPQSGQRARTRLRKNGFWLDATPYPVKYHGAILSRLRRIAGVPAGQRPPLECHLELVGKRARIPAIASFTSTLRGERCVLRFPENVPLIQFPLRLLALGDVRARHFHNRLAGAGGGLFLITAQKIRYAHQLYSSLLLEQATANRAVVSVDWTLERHIPNVHHVEAHDEEAFRRSLDHFAHDPPGLLGIQTVPRSEHLNAVFDLSLRGQSVLACFAAAGARQMMDLFSVGGIDAMTLGRGLIAHVHATRVPRLCASCRESFTPSSAEIPDWAADLPLDSFQHGAGCPACAGTGRRGMNWVCETWVPNPEGPDPLMLLRPREEILRDLVRTGEADVRDVR